MLLSWLCEHLAGDAQFRNRNLSWVAVLSPPYHTRAGLCELGLWFRMMREDFKDDISQTSGLSVRPPGVDDGVEASNGGWRPWAWVHLWMLRIV